MKKQIVIPQKSTLYCPDESIDTDAFYREYKAIGDKKQITEF